MLNENAKKWVAALRSGEYKQTCGALKGADGYCCLGVACAIAIQAGVGSWPQTLTTGQLPTEIQHYFGLRNSTPGYYDNTGERRTLEGHNDGYKEKGIAPKSFAEIADIIESEQAVLFV